MSTARRAQSVIPNAAPFNSFTISTHPTTNEQVDTAHPWNSFLSNASSHALLKTLQNWNTSMKELYRGAGATLITSGFRSSMTTPSSSKHSRTVSNRPGWSRILSCAPLAAGSRGLMIVYGGEWLTRSSEVSKVSRYSVNCRDFCRSACMPASSKIFRDAMTAERSSALGFDSWKPAAPCRGTKSVRHVSWLFMFVLCTYCWSSENGCFCHLPTSQSIVVDTSRLILSYRPGRVSHGRRDRQ